MTEEHKQPDLPPETEGTNTFDGLGAEPAAKDNIFAGDNGGSETEQSQNSGLKPPDDRHAHPESVLKEVMHLARASREMSLRMESMVTGYRQIIMHFLKLSEEFEPLTT